MIGFSLAAACAPTAKHRSDATEEEDDKHQALHHHPDICVLLLQEVQEDVLRHQHCTVVAQSCNHLNERGRTHRRSRILYPHNRGDMTCRSVIGCVLLEKGLEGRMDDVSRGHAVTVDGDPNPCIDDSLTIFHLIPKPGRAEHRLAHIQSFIETVEVSICIKYLFVRFQYLSDREQDRENERTREQEGQATRERKKKS